VGNLNLKGNNIRLLKVKEEDYVSLNDIAAAAKYKDTGERIKAWIRAISTIKFLAEWEKLYNPNFNSGRYARVKEEVFDNQFRFTPTKWVETVGAIGIIPARPGRYSKGAFAHIDIALHFAGTLSEGFQLYIIKEFRRLKEDESMRLGDPFNIKRHLVTGNFQLMAREILSSMDERLLTHPQPYKSRLPFASEADLLNTIVFGKTAKEWRLQNPNAPTNRNQRDYANVIQLAVMNNLEFLNALLIHWEMDKGEREPILGNVAKWLFDAFKSFPTMTKLQDLADKFKK